MNIVTFFSNYKNNHIKNLIDENVPKIGKEIGKQVSYNSAEKMWAIFENSLSKESFSCDVENRKITFSDYSLFSFVERLIASIGESIILKIEIDRRPAAFSHEYCDVLIKEILENGAEITFEYFDIWRILVGIASNSELKRACIIPARTAVLTQELLNQYIEDEKTQDQGSKNGFHEITAIDAILFQSLEKHRLCDILKKCPCIFIKVLHNGIPYHISAPTLLKSRYFHQLLFGEFQSKPLSYQSGELEFNLEIGAPQEDLLAYFLHALEAVHDGNLTSHSISSLVLAYLNAHLYEHIEMEKKLLNTIIISGKTGILEEECSRITLFLLSVDKDLYIKVRRSLARIIFQSRSFLQKMSGKNLLSILRRDPALFLCAIEFYDLPLTSLKSLYTETTRELCFGDITLTQEQMSEMAKLGITTSFKLKKSELLEKFKSIPFEELPPALQSNIFFIEMAVMGLNGATDHSRSEMGNDRSIMLSLIKRNESLFRYTSEALRNDREIVLAAVQKNGYNLKYASETLRNDREIVLAAIQRNGLALQYASETLRNDREIVLAAVQKHGLALEYASETLRNDREIVLAAVQKHGSALEYVSETLRNYREIVLAAIQENGLALQYASAALQSDREIVLAAIQENGLALQYASAALQSDREIVLTAVQQNGEALRYASAALQSDREIVLAAVQKNGLALQHASEALRNDPKIVFAAIQQNGLALQYASQSVRFARAIELAPVQQNRRNEMCK